MDEGKLVAGIVAGIFIVSVVSAVFLPPVEEAKPQYIDIDDIDVKVSDVREAYADIEFLVYFIRSDIVKNGTLNVKLYDIKTDTLIDERVFEIPEKDGDRLNVTLRLERDANYKVVFKVCIDDKTYDSKSLILKNLDMLIPKDREFKVVLKDIDFMLTDVKNESTTVKVRFYLDSMKDYRNTVFHIKAIQYESNVLADESWISRDVLGGKTVVIESNLTIPRGYNYLVKLEAWRNGSLLKIWKERLNLAPTKKISKEEVEKEVKFEVEKFVKHTPIPTPALRKYGGEVGIVTKSPGFEVLVLTIAGGVAIWLRSRRLGRS